MVLAIAACGPDEAPRVEATVLRPHADTVAFEVAAEAHRCSGGPSLLFQASDERGNGVLVVLRRPDSVATGAFPLIALGDSLTPRGANVAVRYMMGDVAHGVSLDSGSVDLTTSGDAMSVQVRGSGLESGVRVAVDATYAGVPLPSRGDTVPCRYMP